MQSRQQTLASIYSFEGKGLHTGKVARVTLNPAPEDTGIRFVRKDMGDTVIPALADYVSNIVRSTTLTYDGVSVATIEHVMSALTGLGVDNAVVELDNEEMPILDGSALPYVKAITADGLVSQAKDRKILVLPREVTVEDPETGAWVKAVPSDSPSYDVKIDFGSRVLGIQQVHWDPSVDYAKEIGPCRTFVFFHEIEFLLNNNLIKGGDVDNAIVIVEHPVDKERVERVAGLFNHPGIEVTPGGYLSNLKLHFPNECGRHKMLDFIGDLRLCGGYLGASITAFKPGHGINTAAAKAIRQLWH